MFNFDVSLEHQTNKCNAELDSEDWNDDPEKAKTVP